MSDIWVCNDCEFSTKDDDEALKHSKKIHPEYHSLSLKSRIK